jgi:hypothetical protein
MRQAKSPVDEVSPKKQKGKRWRREGKGRSFETATARVLESTRPAARVLANVRIVGRLSRVKRQVDVQVVSPADYEVLNFECKDHARPVDVEVVDAFAGKLRDIGARRGAIVSNSGYTRAALNMAEAIGVDTLALVDTEDPTIQAKIYVPALVRDTFVRDVGVLASLLTSSGLVPTMLSQLILLDASNKRDTAAAVFAKAWNSGAVPMVPGNHVITFDTLGYSRYERLDGGIADAKELPIGAAISQRCWLGELEILKSEGLYDVRTHGYETRSLTTAPLDVTQLPSWTVVPCQPSSPVAVTMEVDVATPLAVVGQDIAAL